VEPQTREAAHELKSRHPARDRERPTSSMSRSLLESIFFRRLYVSRTTCSTRSQATMLMIRL
jgi:hypothetical protein